MDDTTVRELGACVEALKRADTGPYGVCRGDVTGSDGVPLALVDDNWDNANMLAACANFLRQHHVAIAEAVADRARLDWMIRNGMRVVKGADEGIYWVEPRIGACCMWAYPTAREAIDGEMADPSPYVDDSGTAERGAAFKSREHGDE